MKGGRIPEKKVSELAIPYEGPDPRQKRSPIGETGRRILGLLQKYPDLTVREMAEALGHHITSTHRQILRLAQLGLIEKSGTITLNGPPTTTWRIRKETSKHL